MDFALTYDLLERLASLLRAEERHVGKELGVEPVHLRALRFLGRANRYSDTPVAVAEYLGLTKGTASQTLIRLQGKGLVTGRPSLKDKRKLHLSLTKAGRAVVSRVNPPRAFKEAFAASSAPSSLDELFLELLTTLQRINGSKSFGICKTCAHFQHRGTGNSYRCGLTEEPLKVRETGLICREHLSLLNEPAGTNDS